MPLCFCTVYPSGVSFEIMTVNTNDRDIKIQNIFKFKTPLVKWNEQMARSLLSNFIFISLLIHLFINHLTTPTMCQELARQWGDPDK